MTTEATKRARASRRKGSSWETDLLKALRGEGIEVERLTKAGKDDEGDLVYRDDIGPIVIEAKAEAKIDLPAYIREAEREADNYAKARGLDRGDVRPVVFIKARGKSWKEGYAVTSISEWLELDK